MLVAGPVVALACKPHTYPSDLGTNQALTMMMVARVMMMTMVLVMMMMVMVRMVIVMIRAGMQGAHVTV